MANARIGYRARMIDERPTPDTDESGSEASHVATHALERQRDRHQADDADTDDEGIGALVNNTGLDGDAASG